MAPPEGMDTYEARLESFTVSIPGSKRRNSIAKGIKAGSWPHKSPSPTELANAGFYYKPSPTSPDNTICFMCERKLDGWEEEDDPIVEHLKHSGNCAWALVMSSGMDGADDPTSIRMVEARRETFEGKWPHEGKRGWVCKVEKMVTAGWHYAPTPESDDFVTCADCKLCLDGWEPKDNPFDEHYRRSPDCRFFTFAGTTAPKASRGKKGRASKTSRLSTQSNATVASEAQDIPHFDDSIDTTTVSVDVIAPSVTKAAVKGAKGTKAKGRGKSKKADTSVIEDSSVLETAKPETKTKVQRSKKRKSDQISTDNERGQHESTIRPEPPSKRRTTRSRNSVVQVAESPALSEDVVQHTSTESAQPTRGGRKRASSRARKVSTASVASKASLRAGVPDDSVIDAELAAELEKPWSEDEAEAQEALLQLEAPKAKNKTKKTETTASKALMRHPEPTTNETEEGPKHTNDGENQDESHLNKEEEKPKKKGKAAKGKSKKTATQAKAEDTASVIDEDSVAINQLSTSGQEESKADEQKVETGSGQQADVDMVEAPKPKKGTKKATGRSKTQKPKGKKAIAEENDEVGIETESHIRGHSPSVQDLMESMPLPPGSGSKKATKGLGKNKEPPQQSMPGAFQPEPSVQPSSPVATSEMKDDVPTPTAFPSSPQRPIQAMTPSPSPQPSDAENQPPSSRPSASRPPLMLQSPLHGQTMRVSLATTPRQSPSKLNRPVAGLNTSFPWNPVDVEMIFAQTPGGTDKENILSNSKIALASPEKRMTVEEWVSYVAHKSEDELKAECERVVGIFEKEGGRAMTTLEGIDCIE